MSIYSETAGGGTSTGRLSLPWIIAASSVGTMIEWYDFYIYGVLAVFFGLMAPAFTRLMLNAPKAFIMVLAGLAMLRVLQGAFSASFKDRFTLGALVSFLVTVADLGLLNIGAAFWGLVAGFAVSWLMERRHFELD